MIILDGRNLSQKISKNLSKEIATFKKVPVLAIVQVGSKEQSNLYIGKKKEFAESIGVTAEHIILPEDLSQKDIESKLSELNRDPDCHGIIIQLPMPPHLNFGDLIESIDPKKDVDGLGPKNIKNLWQGNSGGIIPATARGILELLEEHKITLSGKKVVIINRSILVGRPLALAVLNKDATVSICHSKTPPDRLKAEIQSADIVIPAVGHPKIFGSEFFKEGQVIVDVGISYLGEKIPEESGSLKISGDVDFENVSKIVKAISPVPGGVGPMTVAALFENLLDAYRLQQ